MHPSGALSRAEGEAQPHREGESSAMSGSLYNGYSWKQREAILRAYQAGEAGPGFSFGGRPCGLCGDPDRAPGEWHSEDYSPPYRFEPPATYVHPHFEELNDTIILSIRCERGPRPAFVKDGQSQRFFVRGGNATTELQGTGKTEYVRQRFD